MHAHRSAATLRHLTEPTLGSAPPLAPGLRRHRVLDPIHFAPGSDLPDAAAHAWLEEQAAVLLWFATAGEIEVLGHAWGEGDEARSRALSLRRAEVVLEALVRHGVPRWAMRARGCGAEQPARASGDAADAADCRRVELWLCQRGHDLEPPPCEDPGGERCCRRC
ncbi:MAG: OmpA family protein [Pseudomonadota bacterium]